MNERQPIVRNFQRTARGILGMLLPSNDRLMNRYPVVEVAEYTGPRYDDPEQLARVRQMLDMHETTDDRQTSTDG